MKHTKRSFFRSFFSFLGLLVLLTAHSKVIGVEIQSREIVMDGKDFGGHGAYELIKGRISFGIDPSNPYNANITDLQLAPRNKEGLVVVQGHLEVLQPLDLSKSRGVALVEVSNRGGKFSPWYFNRARVRDLDASNPEHYGNALLLRHGLTIIWVGWEFDVPRKEGLLSLDVPVARQADGSSIFGMVRSDWTVDEAVNVLGIGHRDQIPYPVADPLSPKAQLTVRVGRDEPRTLIPREKWSFEKFEDGRKVEDDQHIYMLEGFEAGKIYELVYEAKDPPIAGLGLAAIRDVISYAKYDTDCPFPVKNGMAAGVSQTGRFLRYFLYRGFNTDEMGRKAYDGMMVITAGAGRGSFNHRFAQPSRDGHRYSAFFYPTDIFPFTGRTQFDPYAAKADGLLNHLTTADHAPKIFYINTAYEYWGRSAALIHIDAMGKGDIPPMLNERIYHLASGQHFVETFPRPETQRIAVERVYRGNFLDFSVNYRALLIRLVEWVSNSASPPENAYPTLAAGTLVSIEKLSFPKLAGVDVPTTMQTAYRADYGPRWEKEGIIDYQPPKLSSVYPQFVPEVDELGNEIGGVRNVELRVPLATYTGWNIRKGFAGGTHELTDFRGTVIPLPLTEAQRQQHLDPRPSIESLYHSKEEYLKNVQEAAWKLVDEGFVLEEDVDYLMDRAAGYWAEGF